MSNDIVHQTTATATDPLDTKISFTVFQDRFAKVGERRGGTWRRLFAAFAAVPPPTKPKDNMPGWLPATFAESRRRKVDARHIHAYVVDIDNKGKDGKRVPENEVVTVERFMKSFIGTYVYVYTSYNHAPDWLRFRAILPLKSHIEIQEYDRLWARMDEHLKGMGIVQDPQTKNLKRMWYMPARTQHFGTWSQDGDFLDAAKWLQDNPVPTRTRWSKKQSAETPDKLERARAYARACDGAVSGAGGHAQAFSVACNVVRGFDLSEDEGLQVLLDEFNDRCDPPWSEEELRHKVKSALEQGNKPPIGEFLTRRGSRREVPASAGDLPTIQIRPEEKEVNDEAIVALRDHSVGLYQRGGRLVRIRDDVVADMSQPTLREELSAVARWETYGEKKGWMSTHPPGFAVSAVHARGEWGLSPLRGVVQAPCMLPDGSILCRAGYDAGSGLFLSGDFDLDVPASPTRDDALRALELLLDLVVDFPFVGDVDRAAAMAAILTVAVRAGLREPVPFFLTRANTPGTGKDLFLKLISRIWMGRAVGVCPPTHDRDETRKRLLPIVQAGGPIAIFDDLSSWGGEVWAALLTAADYSDRVLGESQTITCPW